MIQADNIPLLTDSVPTRKQEIEMLKDLPFDQFVDTAVSSMVHFAINLVVAIVVFYIGKFIIRKINSLIKTVMIRRRADQSLATFIESLVRIVLYFLLVVTVIGILGIETSSFIALFASAGVAIGMALSGTLQNFAGGVLILLLKPYKVGDYIEAQGYAGTVKEIQIFHTIITTPDNKSIIIPNGGLSTDSINNYSREDYRRVEWVVAISYGDKVDDARQAILEMLDGDERVVKHTIEEDRQAREERQLQDMAQSDSKHSWLYGLFRRPGQSVKAKINDRLAQEQQKTQSMIKKVSRKPTVYVKELADSSVNLTIRAWTTNTDYWSLFYDINERLYNELPDHGIHFPFPQMDVHVRSEGSEK